MFRYVIFGAGGLAAEVCNWIILPNLPRWKPIGCVAAFFAETATQKEFFDIPIITELDKLPIAEECQQPTRFITAVGDPHLKERFSIMAIRSGLIPCEGIVPQSVIFALDSSIGDNSIICPNAFVTTRVKIGYGCVVHYNCSIGHDTVIGDYSTILPGANISGNVNIGKYVVVGSNACIREKLHIADNVFIGMGSVVVKDILEPGTYVGNPLRKLK